MSDGTSLRQSWYNALDEAQTAFRRHLTSSGSLEWKRIPVPSENASKKAKGKVRSSVPDLADVVVHRKAFPNEDTVYRVVLDIPTGDDPVPLDSWKSILATPELRREWDPAVEGASSIEMFDPTTRIAKTRFTLGWPANPRDAVTISRMFNDATTVIDISTSLPRSSDEPAYLRPSPPYVRSDVKLFAWCVQQIQPSANNLETPSDEASLKTVTPGPGRLRITCFWQHDLRALWNFASTSGMAQQLASMVLGLFKTAIKRRCRVPVLTGYGNGVTIERSRFDIDRESLAIDYAIIPEDDDRSMHTLDSGTTLEDLHARREHRRLARSVEFSIPITEGWDIQLSTSASSEQVAQLPWTARAYRNDSSAPSTSTAIDSSDGENVTFLVSHTSLLDDHSVLKVRIVIERSGPSSGLRLNGIPQRIEMLETRNPSSYFMSEQMLQDATSTADLSFHTVSSTNTGGTTLSVSSGSKTPLRPQLNRTFTTRSSTQEKSILSRVRRNYIYFSSLLQEPEAKWRRTTEARGVSVTQLDSIDPTLVVYRAEATFVGVGLWDLYAAITSPGARTYWDKQHEDATLLEDVNELTELWHFKAKPAWPTNARDSVLLKTVYKSSTTVHVFSFSADDPNLFPNIPPPDPNTIRTQVDLQGFAIESLSPSTTLLTLLEQSDPKGWSNKASIPQQMITVLAGVGEFAIRCGGPPVATRLAGAKATEMRYDHERGVFRIEYEVSASRRAAPSTVSTASSAPEVDTSSSSSNPIVECELRCDIDTWANSLDIVVDPPPQSISCFRRHRLSSGGGGLWLTLTHDAVLAGEERLMAIVRKGPGRERGVVMVNGSKVTVDVEELPEAEIKSLSKQKRIKPTRIPLDQPPIMGVIRRRKMEWSEGDGPSEPASYAPTPAASSDSKAGLSLSGMSTTSSWTGTMPKFPSPLSRYFTFAMEQAASTTQQAVAAISPMSADESAFSATKPPMQYALEALSYVRNMHFSPTLEGWTPVATKGFSIYRTLAPEVSPSVPTYKGEKVIEGISAEEIAAVVTNYDSRKNWDERFDSAHVLETFGAKCHTAFVVSKSGFPFRDRGFYLASVMARGQEQNAGDRTAIFIVAASFNPHAVARFAPGKYNPYTLPIGRMFVDAWVLETLDPYTPENYAIPSTRCTRFVAADYAGSIPAAVNAMTNSTLVKSVLAVEAYVKDISSAPLTRLPTAGMVLIDKRAEGEAAPASWALKRKDEARLLVWTRYTPEDQVYKGTLLLSLPPPVAPQPQVAPPEPMSRTGSPETSSSDEAQPQAGSRPHSRSVSSVPASLAPRRRRLSSTRQTMRSASRDAALRTSSSAFTIRGEVRQHTDFLVAEFVVDSKLYADGYAVTLRSRIHDGTRPISLADDAEEAETVLPLTWTIHTLPSSPMHSSGLTADRPPRHLVRLTLPTAQQQISTLLDPLTGETRQPPPKPQWLVDLQNAGAAIEVEIRPAGLGSGGGVSVNGKAARVEGEKESLTSLGREELQDDRVAKMMVLTRSSSDEGELPKQLQIAVGEADQLLDPASVVCGSVSIEESKESEDTNGGTDGGQDHAGAPTPPDSQPGTPGTAVPNAGGGFLGFLQSYQNPLLRFTSGSPVNTRATSPAGSSGSSQVSASPRAGLRAMPMPGVSVHTGTMSYPLSTVVVIAVIAFLIGSLLRSLISPADFIYVVADKGETEARTGWREIRRLVEIKYIVGGWDFQIAVVRRH